QTLLTVQVIDGVDARARAEAAAVVRVLDELRRRAERAAGRGDELLALVLHARREPVRERRGRARIVLVFVRPRRRPSAPLLAPQPREACEELLAHALGSGGSAAGTNSGPSSRKAR